MKRWLKRIITAGIIVEKRLKKKKNFLAKIRKI